MPLLPKLCTVHSALPNPLAARAKAWVCGRSLTEVASSNPAREHGGISPVSVVSRQVDVSAPV
jgi:hypothetical protein